MRKTNHFPKIFTGILVIFLFFFESYGKLDSIGNEAQNQNAKRKLEFLIAKNRPGLSEKERNQLVKATLRASQLLQFPKRNQVSYTPPVDRLGFLVGLIQTESQFHTHAKSHKGALGLMQVMPETAKWLAKKEGISFSQANELYEPETNLLLGVLYLNYLMERTDSLEATLLAYNAGLGGYKRFGGVPAYSRTVYKYYDEWKGMVIPQEIPISETLASLISI
ncbi:lytic transglycosylase domain-containing protein [Leptospira jelokensis]|uniref:Lytic transglycosylase domain-containing protein n=1 Tax=Leptospira jelokensis TaxID=2484931 RepID=A0A4Z0ZWD9_9LEPT|nr:lytic transglycosylase domain-containing protein [Leptospira jelokensis]TGL59822.1 lytic transglycosylase domain-containing protein [Leptospira jelokensis]